MTGARERAALVATAGLLAALALIAPGFFAAGNLRDLAVSNAPVLLVCAAMTLVVLVGHIDVSVGAQFGICAILAGLIARAGAPLVVVAAVAVGSGAVVGAVNGWLVAGLRLPSIVVTLAMLAVLRDGVRWTTEGAWVRDLPRDFQWMGLGQTRGQWVIGLTTLVVLGAVGWALRHLGAGRAVYATGSDFESARLAGLRPSGVVFGTFVACGALTGLAALLNAVRFADVQGSVAAGLELKAIAAVVVGGATITGGAGSLRGTLIGGLLLGIIGTGLVYLGVSAYWERALQGAIILAALVADVAASRGMPATPAHA